MTLSPDSKSLFLGDSFSLKREGIVFMSKGGPIRLFAVNKEGLRLFLTSISSGTLFSFPPFEGGDILAVCDGETELSELTEASFGPLDPIRLDEWVEKLSLPLKKSPPPLPSHILSAGKSSDIPEKSLVIGGRNVHTSQKAEILWVRPTGGKLFLLGNASLEITDWFPLSPSLWLTSDTALTLQVLSTKTLIEEAKAFPAIHAFASLLTRHLPQLFSQKEEEEQSLLANRSLEETEHLSLALEEMEEVLAPTFAPRVKHSKDPLIEACQILGQALKIEFHIPPDGRHKSLEEILGLLPFRSRKVTLSKKKWMQDHGPLLGFYGPDKTPVALLYSSGYTLYPGHTRVTERVARDLSPTAYMFYPPFPEQIKTGEEVLRFALSRLIRPLLSLVSFSIAGALLALFPAIATHLLFSFAIPESDPYLVHYLTLGLLCSAVGFSFFYFIRDLIFLKIEGLGTHWIQSAFWDRLLKLSPGFFRKFTIGNLFWRIHSIEEIRNSISGNAATTILSGLFSLFYLVIMALYSPLLTLIVFSIALVALAATAICASIRTKLLRELFEVQGKIQGAVIQMIGGVGKLRVAGAERSAFAYWASHFAQSKVLQMRARALQNIVSLLAGALPIFSLFGVYFTILNFMRITSFALPDFLAFNIAFGSFVLAFYPLTTMWIQLMTIPPLWERSRVLLQEPLEERLQKTDPGKLSGELSLDEITFSYHPNTPPVLNNISLTIKPGELVAIVGPSGSGKSTLIRLLLGFETPQSGAIYYDGKDLSSLDLRAVRKQIGVVFQGEGIMAGQIYENLACGGIYSEEEMTRALKLSGFQEDLEAFPMGLHTYLQAKGVTLSGGQKQRLLLARALLSNPSILILDEATSALDNRTQEAIHYNIEELNVTRILVAQRLSTIRNADRIYVLDQGRIVQTGTFAELSQTPGLFAGMLARQKI